MAWTKGVPQKDGYYWARHEFRPHDITVAHLETVFDTRFGYTIGSECNLIDGGLETGGEEDLWEFWDEAICPPA